jgi:hypothetical protein
VAWKENLTILFDLQHVTAPAQQVRYAVAEGLSGAPRQALFAMSAHSALPANFDDLVQFLRARYVPAVSVGALYITLLDRTAHPSGPASVDSFNKLRQEVQSTVDLLRYSGEAESFQRMAAARFITRLPEPFQRKLLKRFDAGQLRTLTETCDAAHELVMRAASEATRSTPKAPPPTPGPPATLYRAEADLPPATAYPPRRYAAECPTKAGRPGPASSWYKGHLPIPDPAWADRTVCWTCGCARSACSAEKGPCSHLA